MRTFAEKPKLTQRAKTAIFTKPSRPLSGQSRDVQSILQSQRTIGNQAVQRLLQSNAEKLQTDSTTTASNSFGHDFSRIPVVSSSPVQIQPKLKVSTPEDKYEREANLIADQVMRMPELRSDSIHSRQDTLAQRPCPSCEVKQRQPSTNDQTARSSVSAKEGMDDLGPGVVLPVATRRFFEPRFGYNFKNVHVHTDTKAARSAAGIQAKAYTLGNDIVLGSGEYQPSTNQGQHLLAHELTHIIQQNTATFRPYVQRLSDPNCSSASRLPFPDSCTNYNNSCYSSSFTAAGGTSVTVNVTVNYHDPHVCSFPDGREDFRVQLKQCGWVDTEVKDLGTSDLGTTLTGTATLPGAGIVLGNDNYYLRVYSRSNCKLAASMSVT